MVHTPDDPTKAQVWITKGLDDLDFEFYFPQGPKGEPGGIVMNVLTAPLTTNFNDLISAGVYSVPVASDAGNSALLNLPYHEAGTLLVTTSNGGSVQIQQYTTNTKGIYVRRRFSGAWSAWRQFGHNRTSETAGRVMYMWDELNMREQLVYGDTGYRDITPVGFTAGTTRIRRNGSQVTMYIIGGTIANSGSFNFPDSLPVGFRPPANSYFLYRQNVTMSTNAVMITSAGVVQIVNYSNTSNCSAVCTWDTADVWPATLPGTAIGSIPQL